MDRLATRRSAMAGSIALAWVMSGWETGAQDGPDAPKPGAVPMFRGNPARTGEHPGPGPSGKPRPLWETRIGTKISTTPAVVDGVVYAGSAAPSTMAGGALHALDAATGAELWRAGTTPGDAIFSSPAVDAGVVYVGSYDGIFVAVESASGQERWRFQAEGAFFSSPAVVDDLVFCGDDAGRLYAIDVLSGAERWRLGSAEAFDRMITASPSISNGTLYIVDSARHVDNEAYLLALASDSGEELWRFRAEDGDNVRSTVAIADDRLHVTTREGILYALDPLDGRELWRYEGGGMPQSLLAVSSGMVALATAGGILRAVDAANGDLIWTHTQESGAEIVGSPTVAQETIYFGDTAGILHAVELASGSEQWQAAVRSYVSSPVAIDGVIFIGGDDGVLRAIGGSSEPDLPHRQPSSDSAGL